MNRILHIIILVLLSGNLYSMNFSEPINAGIINSESNEFAPSWNIENSTLYFCSNQSGFEKFYTSSLNPDGKFRESSFLKDKINNTSKNVSYISFDGNTAYFSAFRKNDFQPVSQIFYSSYEKQSWENGFPIDELKSKNFRGQPTISPDGKTMIFVSDGNDGDLDLYMSIKDPDGNWREPEIITGINSTGNELSPFLSSPDTLFFASDGQGGPGGFDLFYSLKEGGIWQRPNPLYNLNSEYNESDITKLPDGRFIFASDRPGGKGKLDLWMTEPKSNKLSDEGKEKVEINLLSYTSKIQLRNDYTYKTLPVSSVLFLQSPTDSLNSSFFDIYTEEEIQEFSDPLESYFATLAIIGRRMQLISDSRLSITVKLPDKIELDKSEKNSKFFADRNITKIIDYLKNIYKISPGRLQYTYDFYRSDSDRPAILLGSKEIRLFDQIEIRKDNLELSQNKLIVESIIKQGGNFNKVAYLKVGNKSFKIADNIESNFFEVDLEKYKKYLFGNRNFKVEMLVKKNKDTISSKDISFRIDNSRKSSTEKTVINNQLFDIYRLFIGPDSELNAVEYEASLNRVYSSITLSKNIIIKYDDTFNETINSVNQLSDLLNKRIVSNTKLEAQKITTSGIKKNLITILIEKYPTTE